MNGAVNSEALAREQAIEESGLSFIELKLLTRRFNGAQGAEILHARPQMDVDSQTEKYKVRVKGGPLLFRRDPYRLGSFVSIPDTEHNRKFLRGVIDAKVIEITDKKIEADIRNGVPAPNSFAAPAAIPAAQPQTIEELTAALSKARAAAGLPPVGLAPDAVAVEPTAVTWTTPPQVVNPPVETEREFVKKSEAEIEEIARKFCEDGERLREADVKPPEPVKKAPAAKSKGKATPKSTFIKMED